MVLITVEVALASIEMNAPIWVVIAPQSGATAPAALAGALVQVLAETLASLMLIDLVKPGHPVVFGPWPFVTDLRTGSFSGGSGEEALMAAAATQITNHYGLSSSVAAGMTDSKYPMHRLVTKRYLLRWLHSQDAIMYQNLQA